MTGEEEYYDPQQEALELTQLQREQMAQVQQSKMLEQTDMNMADAQLQIEEELENMANMLQGKVLSRNKDGELVWENPKNDEDIILSEHGVNLVMGVCRFYVNKNTLLANYDAETILQKMEDLSTSLAGALFMSYEKYFKQPSFEDVETVFKERIDRKLKDILATKQLREEEYDEKEIRRELIDEVDPTTERIKIRQQLIKNKLKGYDLLARKIQDFIHSAYQRSWRGEERRTLRQHWHISESRNPDSNIPKPSGGGGIFSWMKKR